MNQNYIATEDRLGSSWFSISRARLENIVSLGHTYLYPQSPYPVVCGWWNRWELTEASLQKSDQISGISSHTKSQLRARNTTDSWKLTTPACSIIEEPHFMYLQYNFCPFYYSRILTKSYSKKNPWKFMNYKLPTYIFSHKKSSSQDFIRRILVQVE